MTSMHATPVGTRFTTTRCLGALALLSSLSAVGTLGSPSLLHQPLLLVLLSPRLPFLALASAHVSPFVLVPVSVARLCAGDVFHFHLGSNGAHRRLADHRVLGIAGVTRARRAFARYRPVVAVRARLRAWGPVARNGVLLAVLVRPVGRHLTVAGAAGTCPRRVAIADLVGTMAYVAVVVLAGTAVR